MEKHLTKRIVIIGFVAAIFFFTIVSFLSFEKLQHASPRVPTSAKIIVPSHETKPVDDMFFSGKTGFTELELLKKVVPVEQDHSRLVVSINGRKVDTKKHEFWAFYVNGKMASVGPAEYVTKDGDKIEWKIEKY